MKKAILITGLFAALLVLAAVGFVLRPPRPAGWRAAPATA
jgi:hypothetical protein